MKSIFSSPDAKSPPLLPQIYHCDIDSPDVNSFYHSSRSNTLDFDDEHTLNSKSIDRSDIGCLVGEIMRSDSSQSQYSIQSSSEKDQNGGLRTIDSTQRGRSYSDDNTDTISRETRVNLGRVIATDDSSASTQHNRLKDGNSDLAMQSLNDENLCPSWQPHNLFPRETRQRAIPSQSNKTIFDESSHRTQSTFITDCSDSELLERPSLCIYTASPPLMCDSDESSMKLTSPKKLLALRRCRANKSIRQALEGHENIENIPIQSNISYLTTKEMVKEIAEEISPKILTNATANDQSKTQNSKTRNRIIHDLQSSQTYGQVDHHNNSSFIPELLSSPRAQGSGTLSNGIDDESCRRSDLPNACPQPPEHIPYAGTEGLKVDDILPRPPATVETKPSFRRKYMYVSYSAVSMR